MKVNFIRKPTLSELIPFDEFIIEKEIVLEKEEFLKFIHDPLNDYDFIGQNIDKMFIKDGIYHCIYVTADDVDYGILVESEGYSYARYAAYLRK